MHVPRYETVLEFHLFGQLGNGCGWTTLFPLILFILLLLLLHLRKDLHLEKLLLLEAEEGRLEHGQVLNRLGVSIWAASGHAGRAAGDARCQL